MISDTNKVALTLGVRPWNILVVLASFLDTRRVGENVLSSKVSARPFASIVQETRTLPFTQA